MALEPPTSRRGLRGVPAATLEGVFNASSALLAFVSIAVLVLQGWAVVDCVIRPTNAFVAAGKLTKPAWAAITVVAFLAGWIFGPLGILGLASVVASIVYLVDVRPAVREVQGGGNRR